MIKTGISTDVVVIGGGAVGTAVAYNLSKKGLGVVLVDRGGLASGTSGRCDGNVLVADKMPGYDSRLNKSSQELFPGLADEIGYDFGWNNRGSLTVMESEKEMEIGSHFCRQLAESGLPVKMLDKKEVHEDEPNLAGDIAGGMEVACDGSLNPMALVYGLGYATERLGGKIWINTTVTGVRRTVDGRIEAVETDKGCINTTRVVCAAGVWTPEIGRMVGLEIPIKPRQGQILVSERTVFVARRKVAEFGYLAAKFESADYQRAVTSEMEGYGIAMVFEPTQAGNFLIGSSRRFTGRHIASHMDVLRALAQRAIRFFPMIMDIAVIRSYAGLRPYTPDHLPIISVTSVPGFYVAAGHEGDGIGLSLITGVLITQLICDEETTVSVDPLRLDRFKTNTKLNETT
jgi:sarcosine oxidase subunit beta